MAKRNRRRSRRARSRVRAAKRLSTSRRETPSGNSLTRSLNIEPLEDRRMLATFNVVNTDDLRPDGDGGLEVVPGSLRDAIVRANETPAADTIVFTGIAFEGPTAIFLENNGAGDFGDIEITEPLSILGPGSNKISISASGGQRIFNIEDDSADTASMQVDITGLTLTGGAAFGMDAEGQGGAIRNVENLTLTEVVISNSNAGNAGGGVFHDVGDLVVDRSLILNNSGRNGGGIHVGSGSDQTDNLPNATIVNSTITGNRATGFAGGEETGGLGGGVFNAAGNLTIEQSTILANSANTYGGGVASQGFDAEKDEDGNATVYSGGAFTTIRSSIIVGNRLGGDPNDLSADEDDVANVGMTEGEPDGDPPVPAEPFQAQIASLGFNVFGVLTNIDETSNLAFEPEGELILAGMNSADEENVDPLTLFIGTPDPDDDMNPERAVPQLAYYGGETLSFMPDENKTGAQSFIIEQGDPDNVEGFFEQRGRHFTRVAGTGMMPVMDVGAVEVQNGVFFVDSLVDESDGAYGIGDFTLREAILFSEANPLRDTIRFSLSLRNEADPNPFTPAPTIVMSLGSFNITQEVDILGPTYQLEIDGNNSFTIFNIDDFDITAATDVAISDLTLVRGGGGINGGAIVTKEDLSVSGVYFLNNAAALNGGGIFIEGTEFDIGMPGNPNIQRVGGNVTIDSSTFAGNFASNNGGAIYVSASANDVDIVNSTISDNDAANRGAGIANFGPDTSVEYSTITLNSSGTTLASGIANFSGGQIEILSTILAGNQNNDIGFFNGPSTNIVSNGYNIVGRGNAVDAGVFNATGDLDGEAFTDPKLAPLTFNAGLTPTHRVLGDSPALDAGDPNAVAGAGGVPMLDQRGIDTILRVFDGDGDTVPIIDIGAYELQEVTYTVSSTADENDGDFSLGQLSLREAIEIANATGGALPERIVFDPLLFGATIFLSPNNLAPFTTPDIQITDPVAIDGQGITLNGAGLFDQFGTYPMLTIDDGDSGQMAVVEISNFRFDAGSDRAVSNSEETTLNDIFATANNGGALENIGGDLILNSSILTGNTSPGAGGAISSIDGNLTIGGDPASYYYTLITGNTTQNTQGHGAGISFVDTTPEGKKLDLSAVVISGNSAPAANTDGAGIYISGNGALSPTAVTEAEIKQSSISGNSTTGSNSEGTGIFARDADVSVLGTTISLNRSVGTNSSGAGIFLSGGSLNIGSLDVNTPYGPTTRTSLITLNQTYGNYAPGGGIANFGGDLTIDQLTISRNQTSGIESHGGGIFNSGGSVTVDSSTISENAVNDGGAKGGGIYHDGDLTGTQTTKILNSTLSGNSTPFRGGGAYNADGLMQIQYSTITLNTVTYYGNGGGVASLGNAATTRTEVRSSIIAGNRSTFEPLDPMDPPNPDGDINFIGGTGTNSFLSLGYNVIGNGLAVGAFTSAGDQTNVSDPFEDGNEWLTELTRIDGGPTSYHKLLPTSPAIGAGDPTAVPGDGLTPEFDQRGEGFGRIVGTIDVGSFESGLAPLVLGPPEDIDEDGIVSGLDFLLIQIGFGTPNATKSDGDTNNDQMVNSVDIANWNSGYGTVSNSAALGASSTPAIAAAIMAPEPESASLAAISEPVVASSSISQSPVSSRVASPSANQAEGTNVFITSLRFTTPDVVWNDPFGGGVREAVLEQFGQALNTSPRELIGPFASGFGDITADLFDLFEEDEADQEFREEDVVFEELGEAVV